MKRWFDRVVMGYLLQVPLLLLIFGVAFVWQFFDSFYSRFLIEPIFGRPIPWAGFLASVGIALVLGFVAETKRGWFVLSRCFNKIPFAGFLTTLVEQWRKFRVLASEHGMVLAPYYRDQSGFWPGVVTGVMPKANGGFLVSVVFMDFPFPKPLLLTEDDTIYTKLTVSEALAYMVSGGLGFRMKGKKLQKRKLGDLVGSPLFTNGPTPTSPAS